MDRDELRREIILTLLERGGEETPRSLARAIGGDTTPNAVRGMLVNLEREGLVRKNEAYGGPSWGIVEAELTGRLERSLRDDDAGDDQQPG